MNAEQLTIYLNDHLAGSTGGVELIRRIAKNQGSRREGLAELAREIEEDRSALLELMRGLGIAEKRPKQAGAWAAEKLGRLKLNGHLFRRAPLSDVLELEGMIMGVNGKLELWRALLEVADGDSRLQRQELERLESRASAQRLRLEDLHRRASREALA